MDASRDGNTGFFSIAFNLPLLDNKRHQWVDYLRGVAIILIVYRHVLIGIQRGNIVVPEVLVDANMVFYSFRMPLFFILSGIFISRSLEKYSIKQLVFKKFDLLFYPYLVWASLQITLQIVMSDVTNSARSWIDYTYLFTQPRELDQFWYLPALFNATVIYIFLKAKLKLHLALQLLLGILLYFISSSFDMLSMISDWMAFYIFFVTGDLIASKIFLPSTKKFLKSYWTLILIIPVFVAVQHYYLQQDFGNFALTAQSDALKPSYFTHLRGQAEFLLIALFGAFCMFVLAFRLQDWKILKFLRIVGYHSLSIYVMHVIVTASVRLSLIIIFGIRDPFVLLFTSIAMGIIIPILFYNLLIKNGPAWFLFSFSRDHEKTTYKKEVKTSLNSR
ncbi:MAG: acyltransferase [Flavisolibacter sp.]|jgi:fucose 4-O-acetylase-like acetyltransferase|nr:acyltransferase [Flavisolibacter sp.]